MWCYLCCGKFELGVPSVLSSLQKVMSTLITPASLRSYISLMNSISKVEQVQVIKEYGNSFEMKRDLKHLLTLMVLILLSVYSTLK